MNALPRPGGPHGVPTLARAVDAAGPEVLSHRIRLHGHEVHFLESGRDSGGPLVVLLHGLASNSATWAKIVPTLGRCAHVLAPDLLGFGDSAKPRGTDYSVAGHAARLRDLLRELALGPAAVVGHSYGGGVALSFVYQFPERVRALGLIASGGLGPELSVALRAASVPGAVSAANALVAATPHRLRRLAHRAAAGLRLATSSDLDAMSRALESLAEPVAREAFLDTIRGAVTWSGQRLAATDHLYLLAELPVLLVAGRRDTCIPYRHTERARERLPHSRLEILDAGHFPHQEQPETIARLLVEFAAAVPGASVHPRAS